MIRISIFLFLILASNSLLIAQESHLNHNHSTAEIEFIKNQNQWHENIEYKADINGGVVYLEENAFTFNILSNDDRNQLHDIKNTTSEEINNFVLHAHAWKFNFINAKTPNIISKGKKKHYYNYLLGNDQSKWASKVGTFTSVIYEGIYPGIDIKAYSHKGNFKYDWIVSAHTNPLQIKIDIQGIETPTVQEGKLILPTSVGDFHESKPYVYQIINGKLIEISCEYVLQNNQLSFVFPDGYDPNFELIIDPELIAATLSGTPSSGWSDNYGHTATFDIEGNIYTGATAGGDNYPATVGAYQTSYGGGGWDIAISKLNSGGTDLLWATFLGGNQSDYPHSMVTNGDQELYVYGSTGSTDYPTTTTAFQTSSGGDSDIIVSHLSSDGSSLIGSTYIGGSSSDGQNQLSINYGDTYRGEIILDFDEKPVVASCTSSNNFPTSTGAYQASLGGMQDAVLLRLNANLSILELSTYFGGADNDNAYATKVNESGEIYLAGSAGDNVPLTANAYQGNFLGGTAGWGNNEIDGFVAKFNSIGNTLIASTYVGTTTGDQIFFLELDSDENVFIYGQGGTDWPVIGEVYVNDNRPQFISKLNAELSTLTLSTTIGAAGGFGDNDFVPDAFLVDNCDNIYISAYSASGDLPLTDDAIFTVGGFYLAVFTPDLETLEYGTMYSGNHVDGGTSRFDKNGTVYQAVCSGGGFSTTADAWATDQATGWDIGVFKINFDVSGVNASISGADVNGCAPFETTFENFSNGDQYLWNFGDGDTSFDFEPSHTYTDPGVYTVSLIVTDSLSCNLADTSTFDIIISTPIDYTPDFSVMVGCNDLSAACTNETGLDFLQYLWDYGDGTVIESYDSEHIYDDPGLYTILLTAIDNGCENTDTISMEVNVVGEVLAVIGNDNLLGCNPYNAEFNNLSAGSVFTWDFGDGSAVAVGQEISHLYNEPGEYEVSLTVEGLGNCDGVDSTTVLVTVIEPLAESSFTLDGSEGCEELTIQANNLSIGEDITYLWEFGDGATSIETNPTHFYDTIGTYTVELNVFDNICDATFSSQQDVIVVERGTYNMDDVNICYHDDEILVDANTNEDISSYLWSTGDTTSSINLVEGIYTIRVFANHCWLEDEFKVLPVKKIELESNLTICEGSQARLSVPYSDGNNFMWNTSEVTSYISVGESGEYTYSFDDSFGCHQDGIFSVELTENTATLYIPNAFTPNNDGINDYFAPVTNNLDEYSISVWNRWGNLVFQSNDPNEKWMGEVETSNQDSEGSSLGEKYYSMNSLYSYRIDYSSHCNTNKQEVSGVISVIR